MGVPSVDRAAARQLAELGVLERDRALEVVLVEGSLVLRREEGETLVFADATGKEITVQKNDIKTRRETRQSLMPTNFHELIPEPEFNHLLAYLLAQRAPK